jgi:tellurite resistance protein
MPYIRSEDSLQAAGAVGENLGRQLGTMMFQLPAMRAEAEARKAETASRKAQTQLTQEQTLTEMLQRDLLGARTEHERISANEVRQRTGQTKQQFDAQVAVGRLMGQYRKALETGDQQAMLEISTSLDNELAKLPAAEQREALQLWTALIGGSSRNPLSAAIKEGSVLMLNKDQTAFTPNAAGTGVDVLAQGGGALSPGEQVLEPAAGATRQSGQVNTYAGPAQMMGLYNLMSTVVNLARSAATAGANPTAEPQDVQQLRDMLQQLLPLLPLSGTNQPRLNTGNPTNDASGTVVDVPGVGEVRIKKRP